MRAWNAFWALVVAGLLASTTAAVAAEAVDRPDVLFIAVDDLNDWVGVLGGHPQAKTPHIDRLAARGMLFANAHAAAPACNPSRAALLTGVLPSSSGVYTNLEDWRVAPQLKRATTLPQYFRRNGYRTLGGGKIFHAHTYFREGFIGFQQPEAWDEFYPSKMRQLPDELRPHGWPMNRNPGIIFGLFDWSPISAEDFATGDGQVIRWAEKRVAQEHEGPRFLAAGIYRPHLPWYNAQRYFDMHPLERIELPATRADDLMDVPLAGQRGLQVGMHEWVLKNDHWKAAVQGYLASISFADAMVGKLIAALDRSGRAEKTVIVLFSDHGLHLGEKGHWRKFSLWEESTHVPLIIVAPGVTTAGSSTRKPVSLMDLYPTLAELCGIDIPSHLEGKSLLPLLRDPKADWDHAAITTWQRNNHAVRTEQYRYIRYADGSEELYDHATDAHEWTNLAPDLAYRDLKERLAARLPRTNAAPATGQ